MTQLRQIIPLCLLTLSIFITSPLRAELINIDNTELKELLDEGVPIIDVRRVDEWNDTGIVEGSHLLTFFDDKGRYDAKKWLSELQENVDTDQPVIIICQVGGRTSIIGKWLGQQLGTVYNVEDGIVGWMKGEGETVVP